MGVCDYQVPLDMSLPEATRETIRRPLSEQVRLRAGKQSVRIAPVNDTNPNSFRDHEVVTFWPVTALGSTSCHTLCSHLPQRYPFWFDQPPSSSPFSVSVSILMGTFFLFQYLGAGWPTSFFGVWWMTCTLAVIPVCSHVADCCSISRYLQCHPKVPSSRSFTRRPHFRFGFMQVIACMSLAVMAILVGLYMGSVPWDPGISLDVPSAAITWRPSRIMAGIRIGEATHPGPDIVLSTLNVASLCMHQDEVQTPSELPMIRLFTETCLTQQILPTIQRKARQCERFVVSGCVCAPRKSAHRSDSQSRGESGGVLISSDLPARPGNTPMDQTTWLSTRAVEAIASVSPDLSIRLVGLYGYSKRYPGHIERTNQLLTRTLDYVAKSTLPCVFLGDFNCDLEELSAWKLLHDRGWQDAAVLQQSKDGKEPLPTWKSYSRIDYILLPPSLIPHFRRYSNVPDTVSDHSQISVVLGLPGTPLPRQVWKPCRDMRSFVEPQGWHDTDWAHLDWTGFHLKVCQRDVEGAYKSFCLLYETMIAEARRRLSVEIPLQQFQGRSSPKIVPKAVHAPVIRQPRHGETTFQVDDAPTVLRQRIRQARRIQSLQGQLEHCLLRDAENAQASLEAARNTWYAVMFSSGFPPNFPAFARDNMGLVLPKVLYPQDLPLVQILHTAMVQHITSWQWQYAKTKKHRYLNFLLSDWQKRWKGSFRNNST